MRRVTKLFGAARAAARLRRTFDHWIAIGRAIQDIDIMNKDEHGQIDYTAVARRLEDEKIAPPVGKIDVAHLRRIMRYYDKVAAWHAALPVDFQITWCAPSTIIRYCPVFASNPKPPKVVGLERALARVDEALSKMDEPQRRALGNDLFQPYRLQVTRPDNPERSTIDQLAEDLIDRLQTAHPSTADRIRAMFNVYTYKQEHRSKSAG